MKSERLFVCNHCGYEETHEMDNDIHALECPHCRDGQLSDKDILKKE